MKTVCVKNGLMVSIIFLIISISVQPCIAIVQNNERLESTSYPNDSKLLAVLGMDKGDYIYNDRIEYEEKNWIPAGDWNVNVRINFSCPDNMKIEVKYSYFAILDDWPYEWITFCHVNKTVTIINGSNPPDINLNYTKYVWPKYQRGFLLKLIIEANLTAYEYIGGEWIKSYNDDIYIEIRDRVRFYESRGSEKTYYIPFIQFYQKLIERFPIFSRLLYVIK